jgi:hypothetical protein
MSALPTSGVQFVMIGSDELAVYPVRQRDRESIGE